MINAPLVRRPGFAATLDPVLVQRRRALRVAPPAGFSPMLSLPAAAESFAAASDWRDDLRFFLGCYVAGLVFFLIMLS